MKAIPNWPVQSEMGKNQFSGIRFDNRKLKLYKKLGTNLFA